MPRIYDSASNPIDYCLKCFPVSEEIAEDIHGHSGDGPDGRGNCFSYDEEHPDYDDMAGFYRCHNCGKKLTSKDNYL